MLKFLFSFIIICFSLTVTLAEESRIVYLDVNKIMQDSNAGKSIKEQLKKRQNNNISKFKKLEEEIKKENDLIAKKNILSQDEFQKKLTELRKDVINYQKDRNKALNEINKARINASANLIKQLSPILEDYSKKLYFSHYSKKNLVMGKKEMEITNDVLKIVNDKIKKIKLN